MLGTFSHSRSRRRQGSSCRKRSATSKVAPPHISRLAHGAKIFEVAGAAFTMSCVRMRVASSDWCASRLRWMTSELETGPPGTALACRNSCVAAYKKDTE